MYRQRIDLEGLAISIMLLRIWLALNFLVLVTWVGAWLTSLWRHHRAAAAPKGPALPSPRRRHGRGHVHPGAA